jgi:hypothetical protein
MSVTELDLARKARDSCVVYIYIAKLEEEERSNGSRLLPPFQNIRCFRFVK